MTRAWRSLAAGCAALLAFALALPVAAAQPIDYIREGRWAQEVLAGLVVGDAVYLATPARPRVLAILTAPSTPSKGSVILVHGLGVHPDFGMIGGVRTRLADAGFTTLSVQMPVLAADAPRDDYRATLPEAGDRIAAAIAWLRARGVREGSRSSRTAWARRWSTPIWRDRTPLRIDAWVPVGMLIDFAVRRRSSRCSTWSPRSEFDEVKATAPARKPTLPKDGCSRDLTIAAPITISTGGSRSSPRRSRRFSSACSPGAADPDAATDASSVPVVVLAARRAGEPVANGEPGIVVGDRSRSG